MAAAQERSPVPRSQSHAARCSCKDQVSYQVRPGQRNPDRNDTARRLRDDCQRLRGENPRDKPALSELPAAVFDEFADVPWRPKFPTAAAMRRRQWQQVIAFFVHPLKVRATIYTTNAR